MKKLITPLQPEPLNTAVVSVKAKEPSCPHNDWVDCSVHRCEKCGWNPVVAEARLAAVRERLEGV